MQKQKINLKTFLIVVKQWPHQAPVDSSNPLVTQMALGKPNGLQNKTKSQESEKKMDKKEWVLIKMEERKGRVIKDHQSIYVENYQRANVIANKIIGSEIPVHLSPSLFSSTSCSSNRTPKPG